MEKERKIMIARLTASALLIGISFIPGVGEIADIILRLIAYLIAGYDILFRAGKNIIHGKIFDECFLMAIASLGAIALLDFTEAATVMLFYQVGEMCADIAVDRSRSSVATLMDIRPDYANLEENGNLTRVSPESVASGSIIVVKPGEKIPLDGKVISGSSSLNTTALTGESLPRDVTVGDSVLSGCINQNGLLRIRTDGVYGESTVAKILELVENAESGKAKTEKFITRFSKIYTPAVVIAALIIAVIPSLITGNWAVWVHRALVFLVVSCPCALVVSIPLGFFGGIGGASRNGILVKGSNYIEALARTKTVVFDKTGTLTKGNFTVTVIHPEAVSPEELLDIAAHAEMYSDHPISQSLREANGKPLDAARVTVAENFAGKGVRTEVDGRSVYLGNESLMTSVGIAVNSGCHHSGTVIHAALDGIYVGHIVISDEIKKQSKDAISDLRKAGVDKTVMLTGDRKSVGDAVAAELGIDETHTDLLPADKVGLLEKLLEQKRKGESLAFVGDGINDAPVLKLADVGIAMGALGSDAAIEAADVVLMDDNPQKVAKAIRISRRTLTIVKENIIVSLLIKSIVLVLGALGFIGMWLAIFADVGVLILAVLNSLRALKK